MAKSSGGSSAFPTGKNMPVVVPGVPAIPAAGTQAGQAALADFLLPKGGTPATQNRGTGKAMAANSPKK